MSTLQERIAEVSAGMKRGWQASLARHCGIKPPSVADWVSGETKTLDGENLLKAAEFFKVRPRWLATGKGQKSADDADIVNIAEARGRRQHGADVEIHHYGTGGSMGTGLVLRDQPGVIQSWTVSAEWVQKNLHNITNARNLAVVTGFGNSMRPMFNPGDPILVDRGVTVCDFDGMYFFRVGSEGYIKQLQRIPTPGGGLIIRAKSLNPTFDPFDIAEGMDFEVFARVVKAWKGEDF